MNGATHPESDLDMALDGILPAEQHRDLKAHLSACVACAAHMSAASRTRQILVEQPWDEHLDRQVVDRAMTRLFPSRPARFRIRLALRPKIALVGLLLVGGVAAAALWRTDRSRSVPAISALGPAAVTTSSGAKRTLDSDSPFAEPSLVGDSATLSGEAPSQRASRAQPSAAVLFAQAVSLRKEGKVDASIAAHLRLQRLYPAARETRLSFAFVGRLLLERGSPEQALAQFNVYLARPGDVEEEALVGRATALAKLGRSTAEVAAWREVLDHHPESVYAARARKRLAELAGKVTPDPDPRP
jgi:TolA-binding protein